MKKDLAILIPCYKAAPTIVETLEAFQKQSPEALKRVACVVIADDCTPDNTLELVRQHWKLAEPPLKFEQREKNMGEMMNVTTAVLGLDSQIEWYFNMHGDNVPTPDFLETFIKHIDKADSKVGIIAGSYHAYDGHKVFETGENYYEQSGSKMIYGTVEAVRSTMFMGCWWHNSCCAFRVKTFKEVGGLPKGMVQKGDYDLLLRVLAKGWNIEYLPKPLMLYREHEGSVSSKNFLNHTDLIETINIDQNYNHVLSFTDKYVVYIHQIVFKTLLRRIVRSVLMGNMQRLQAALKVTGMAWRAFFKSLA
jgi:GT2 family glycosyltransferase